MDKMGFYETLIESKSLDEFLAEVRNNGEDKNGAQIVRPDFDARNHLTSSLMKVAPKLCSELIEIINGDDNLKEILTEEGYTKKIVGRTYNNCCGEKKLLIFSAAMSIENNPRVSYVNYCSTCKSVYE
jgi:hypothetical protein